MVTGGKSGQEQEFDGFTVRNTLGTRNQPLSQRLLLHLLQRTSLAIIRNLDDYVIPLLKGRECNGPLFLLSPAKPLFGNFDAMVDSVSYDMQHRVRNIFNNHLVKFGFSAEHLEFDLFSLLPRNLANDSGHFFKKLAYRYHPDIENPFLQVVQLPF